MAAQAGSSGSLALRSQIACSMAAAAPGPSPWPPGFSLRRIVASTFCGSKLWPSRASSDSGAAPSRRGIMRSRMIPLCAKRPIELKPRPTTGLPPRTTSVITATRETVCSEKLTTALATAPSRGTASSRTSVMRMVLESAVSLGGDAGGLDDGAPFGELGVDESAEFGSRTGDHDHSEVGQASLDRLVTQHSLQVGVQPVPNGGIEALGRDDTQPAQSVEAGHAGLRHGRHVRQLRSAVGGRHGEHTHLAGLDVR